MSFDWMSFATGFLERTEEIRSGREEEAKQFEEEQRQAAQRNIQTISQRRAVVDRVVGYTNYLRSNGATDAQIQAAIASGPDGIVEFAESVQQAVANNNNRPLSSDEVATLINMPRGFTGVDMDMQEYANRTFGLYAPAQEQPEQEEFGLLDRISGRDQMARARQRLGRTPMAEDLTIEQINQLASSAEYQSLVPGTFVTYAAAPTYTRDDADAFTRAFEDELRLIQETPEYTSARARLGDEMGLQAQEQLRREGLDAVIMDYAGQDPEGFMRRHEVTLRMNLGEQYVEELKERLGLTAPEPEEEEGQDTGDTEGEGSDVATSVVTENIEVSTLPPANVAPRAEDINIDEEEVDPESITEPDPDTTVLVEDGEEYTYQQWQNMSRTERIAAGLPTSVIGGQLYFRRFAAGIGGLPFIGGQEGTSQSRRDERAPTTVIEEGEAAGGSRGRRVVRDARQAASELENLGVDTDTIRILNERGADIQGYVIEQGATSPLDIARAIEEYAGQQNIELPGDLSAMVHAIRTSLPQQ